MFELCEKCSIADYVLRGDWTCDDCEKEGDRATGDPLPPCVGT